MSTSIFAPVTVKGDQVGAESFRPSRTSHRISVDVHQMGQIARLHFHGGWNAIERARIALDVGAGCVNVRKRIEIRIAMGSFETNSGPADVTFRRRRFTGSGAHDPSPAAFRILGDDALAEKESEVEDYVVSAQASNPRCPPTKERLANCVFSKTRNEQGCMVRKPGRHRVETGAFQRKLDVEDVEEIAQGFDPVGSLLKQISFVLSGGVEVQEGRIPAMRRREERIVGQRFPQALRARPSARSKQMQQRHFEPANAGREKNLFERAGGSRVLLKKECRHGVV